MVLHSITHLQLNQVVAPKGLNVLAISQPTTVVMPNQIGFAQIYFQGTEPVANTPWDSNSQDSISHSTEGKGGENALFFQWLPFSQ